MPERQGDRRAGRMDAAGGTSSFQKGGPCARPPFLVLSVLLGLELLHPVLELRGHVGIAQGGHITQLAALGDVPQQAAHMILPERVLGRSSAQMMRLGRAILPIRLATVSPISPSSSS